MLCVFDNERLNKLLNLKKIHFRVGHLTSHSSLDYLNSCRYGFALFSIQTIPVRPPVTGGLDRCLVSNQMSETPSTRNAGFGTLSVTTTNHQEPSVQA